METYRFPYLILEDFEAILSKTGGIDCDFTFLWSDYTQAYCMGGYVIANNLEEAKIKFLYRLPSNLRICVGFLKISKSEIKKVYSCIWSKKSFVILNSPTIPQFAHFQPVKFLIKHSKKHENREISENA